MLDMLEFQYELETEPAKWWDPCGWDAGSDLLQQAPAFTPKIMCAKTQGLISLLLPLQMEAQL